MLLGRAGRGCVCLIKGSTDTMADTRDNLNRGGRSVASSWLARRTSSVARLLRGRQQVTVALHAEPWGGPSPAALAA